VTVSVNGVTVVTSSDDAAAFAAARELLRQRAVAIGLLDGQCETPVQVDAAIEELLVREVRTPAPTEEECRRYYEQHPREFESGDLVHARHILFQVTAHVNVPEVRKRAEEALNTLLREPDRFEALARELSNCPSGQQGGNLGQIARGDTVPEFEKALFRFGSAGVLRDLVKTRYGFHIVAVDKRILGTRVPFETIRERLVERLCTVVQEKAIRQYVGVLAGRADIHGADLAAATTPLVQ
jgi:peptidyl-prolyl cis-trans isomerase C